jgi:hypothetical protein
VVCREKECDLEFCVRISLTAELTIQELFNELWEPHLLVDAATACSNEKYEPS